MLMVLYEQVDFLEQFLWPLHSIFFSSRFVRCLGHGAGRAPLEGWKFEKTSQIGNYTDLKCQ